MIASLDCSLESTKKLNVAELQVALCNFIAKTNRLPEEIILAGMVYTKPDINLDTLGIKARQTKTVDYLSPDRKHAYRLTFTRSMRGLISFDNVSSHNLRP